MGGFLKMFAPLVDALMYAFNKLAPLIVPLLLSLAKKIFEFVTSEQFLSILKKAGPIIALVMFGPSLLKSLTGALTGALAAAATDAVRDAFLGPGSKKISEMTGKQFSEMMAKATPPPAPPGAGGPIIPPGTPSPAEATQAQATGAVIDSALIIKLLLALAAIITMGLITFYAASKMVANMSREQIENTLLTLAGIAIAILPAAIAMKMLANVNPASLLAAIPAMVALGLVIPMMASLAVEIAKQLAAVPYSDVLKAITLIMGMSIALIPAAFALAELAGVGSLVAGAAPVILVSLLALGLLVPAMGILGIKLAEMVAGLELGSIVKAIIMLSGMSIALLAASSALAGLAAIGTIAAIVGVAIVGLAAVGLIALAMFELAPSLAEAASSIPLPQILKALAILGAMAVAVVEVAVSMVLLAAAGALSLLAPVITMGLNAVNEVGVGLLNSAKILVEGSSGLKVGKLLPVLGALGLMAVAIAEVIPSMILLAAAGALVALYLLIVLGLEAVESVALDLFEMAPTLADGASGVDSRAVANAMGIMAIMSIAIAQSIGAMLLLVEAGGLALLVVPIYIGLKAVEKVSLTLFEMAPVLANAAKGVNSDSVLNAMAIMGIMSLAIVQAIANMLLLVAASPLAVIYKVIKLGLRGVKWVGLDMLDAGNALAEKAKTMSASSVLDAMGVLGTIILAFLELAVAALLLVALSAVFFVYPLVKLGLKAMKWVAEDMADAAPDIAKSAQKVGAAGIKEALPDLKSFAEQLKVFGEIIDSVAKMSSIVEGPIEALDFGWTDTADDKAKLMGELRKTMDSMMGAPGGGGLIGLIEVILKGVAQLGASSETLDAAKSLSEMLAAVGKLAEAMRPSPAFFEAVKAADNDDVKETMTNGLAGLQNLMKEASTQIQAIINVIAEKVLPAVASMSPQQMEQAANLAPIIEAIGKVVSAMQPSDKVMEIIQEAQGSFFKIQNTMNGMTEFFKAMSPLITTLMSDLATHIPTLVKGVIGAGITPDQVEALQAIAPLLSALGTLVGNLLGPMSELMVKADVDLTDAEEVADTLKNIGKMFTVMEGALMSLVRPGGPMAKLITLATSISPEQAESASKITGVINAVGSLAKGLLPGPELLKAIQDASKDKAKLEQLMSGITTIADVLSANVGNMMGSLSALISQVGTVTVTPDQVKLMEVLAPLMSSVSKLVSDLITSVTKKAPPKAEEMGPLKDFMDKTVEHMKTIFESMSKTAADMVAAVADAIKSIASKGIKPDALKSGMESLKGAFDIIGSVSNVMKDISTMATKTDPKGAVSFDPSGYGVLLEKVKELIDSIFKGGHLNTIAEGLGKLPADFAKKKAEVETLKLTFEMINSLNTVINSFKGKKGKIEIDPKSIAENVGKLAGVVGSLADDENIKALPGKLTALSGLAKQKENITNVDQSLKGLGTLSATMVTEGTKMQDVTGIKDSLKTKMQSLATALDELGTASSQTGQAVTKVVTDFKVTTLQKSLTELQNIVKAVQQLDNALANLGNINLQSRMTAIAGSAGLGAAGIYTVKSKDVVVQITLNVTMDAGGVEKAIISNAKSEIKTVVNYLSDNLAKDSADLKDHIPSQHHL